MQNFATYNIGDEIETTDLPGYLQEDGKADTVSLCSLTDISSLNTNEQLFQLLLHREWLTAKLALHGKCHPPLILERANVYEKLCYHDLAAFDAYTVHALCSKELNDEFVTDLTAHELDGSMWLSNLDDKQRHQTVESLQTQASSILTRCMAGLGDVRNPWQTDESQSNIQKRFGHSRREIYPWSSYEPSRNTPEAVNEINSYLSTISSDIEARVTGLPAFDSSGNATREISYQLGLFAKHNLSPGKCILNEKSLITAIRPIDSAICDACACDINAIPWDEVRQCDGEDCDITFCSQNCKHRAVNEYHKPAGDENDQTDESDDGNDTDGENDEVSSHHSNYSINNNSITPTQSMMSPAPFCGNEDLSSIGHPTNSSTPEWDLYFLLLTRVIAMSLTQSKHPLSFTDIKFLWGDFNPQLTLLDSQDTIHLQTLPFSIRHNLEYPLDYFTTLSLSDARATPYSKFWLENYDTWILQNLFAKFRGVANATQSTFDGGPETASVHPGWCLANHSCSPNVRWTPTGERRFYVRTKEEIGDQAWQGIKADEEILSHYTDIRLEKKERQERLQEVLGGMCQCERCLREE